MATRPRKFGISCGIRFYPRHPRGWRPGVWPPVVEVCDVSIHATLAGGDTEWRGGAESETRFLSTPPSRVATGRRRRPGPRENCFYPRHPRGWRRGSLAKKTPPKLFLSTPPSRVATANSPVQTGKYKFLSTPPSRVATFTASLKSSVLLSFYPRHPRGWRRNAPCSDEIFVPVSIHATLAGGDTFR